MRNNSVITNLRSLVPPKRLPPTEALGLAEDQANRLLDLANITEPPVSEDIITELPNIQVERTQLTGAQAAAEWSRGRWLILINGTLSRGRQRFSLAHEFKHIIDNPFVTTLYRSRDKCIPEQACDYFAACLLVPGRWLRQAWAEGTHDAHALARRFGVSPLAVKIRLLQIGLIEPTSHYLAKEA